MKSIYLFLLSVVLTTIFSFNLTAQLPGYINREATSGVGKLILDPNGDRYTSVTTAGFGNDDVANSELVYIGIRAYSIEPFGDLRRGPNHGFSDFVPDALGNGVYHRFSPAQNMMFRMRLGSIMPGSKGYSILMDTDGKFGATGPNADPNYLPSTTGTNGNPGFEIEIVLETNFRIAIYNVDGTSSPVMIKQYLNWQDMSQVSIASTNDNGDPDFLIDFYIPFSDLMAAPFNLTTASPIRLCATTVMAPKAATGGPRSDIYGTAGDTYEDFILGQPACTIFTNPVTCPTAMCSAAPTVNSPIGTGTVNITGTWTKSALPGAASLANITVYKNGTSVGTVPSITSGNAWSLNGITLINGDVITAKSQATGESMCLVSNAVAATNCNSTNRPAQPTGFCADRKGFDATNYPAGATINIYKMTTAGSSLVYTGLRGTTYAGITTVVNGAGWQISSGCSGGNGNYDGGSYTCFYTLGGCDSKVSFSCAPNTVGGWNSLPSPTPVINNASAIYPSTLSISGTADATSLIRIYIDDIFVANASLTGSNWSYTFTSPLRTGQVISVRAQIPDNSGTKIYYCTGLATATVVCYTKPPVINADNNNQIAAGAPVTGTSTESVGTTIKVYSVPATLVATTAVQPNGTWSTGNAGTLPAIYNAVAATSYFANAQNGTCGVSINSDTSTASAPTSAGRCGTITGPVSSGNGTVSGTLTGSFTTSTVNLYLDGELIGTTTTNGTTWGPITVNSTATNTLYSNGVLSIGIQETGKQEVNCPASALAITCTPTPVAPVYSLSSSNVNQNQTITCTITNALIGTFYALSDSATGQSFGMGAWATSNGNLVLTTNAFTTPGTYKVKVSATSLSVLTVCKAVSASTTIVVNPTVLPLSLLEFKGRKQSAGNLLEWTTENEVKLSRYEIERSLNGATFVKLGEVAASGISNTQKRYVFADNFPNASYNYYRLKMIDNDGRYTYSNVVALSGSQTDRLTIEKIKPNPFTDFIEIAFVLKEPQQVSVQLVDVSGRPAYTKTFEGYAGENNIKLERLSGLVQGIYFMKIITANAVLQQKVLKVN